MPEPTDATPADASGTPPEGTPTPTPPAGNPDAAPAAASDLEALRRELADTRREAAGYRTRLKTFEDAQKTDAEKTTERIAALEAENARLAAAHRAVTIRDAAQAAARKAGFWDPEIGASLVNTNDIQFDDEGNPKNMDALVAAIAKDKPRLINGGGTPDFGGGVRGAPAAGHTMDDLIRRAAGR